jgi:hypothetical protein
MAFFAAMLRRGRSTEAGVEVVFFRGKDAPVGGAGFCAITVPSVGLTVKT